MVLTRDNKYQLGFKREKIKTFVNLSIMIQNKKLIKYYSENQSQNSWKCLNMHFKALKDFPNRFTSIQIIISFENFTNKKQ